MSSLQVLSLEDNGLTGTLPDSFGSLPSLFALFVYSNRLNGTIPHNLVGSTGGGKLRYLELGNNELSGTFPESFGKLNQLGK